MKSVHTAGWKLPGASRNRWLVAALLMCLVTPCLADKASPMPMAPVSADPPEPARTGWNFSTIYSFNGRDGDQPIGGLVQGSDGSLYGTTAFRGEHHGGTVFKITASGVLTKLYTFQGKVGELPAAPLTQGSDGSFYGTTAEGGANGKKYGTVFRITGSGELTTLHSFAGKDGARPVARLVQGSDGGLYGTTELGGAGGADGASGTVFKISTTGMFTTLYSFSGKDGSQPVAGLIQCGEGTFFGTTKTGGANDRGTVFKITETGVLTTLYSFNTKDGANPSSGLAQGTDGSLYGTTHGGGTNGDFGTAFKITLSGALSTLYSFHDKDGAHPMAGLALGNDGNFYGTTAAGGAYGKYGTVFKLTQSGLLTTLYSFGIKHASIFKMKIGGKDGDFPVSTLVKGSDGCFYGTTWIGGANELNGVTVGGTVFKITPSP